MNRIELADNPTPYGFPFVAVLRGEARDFRRIDTPVIVQGFMGSERHYYRIKLPCGRMSVANDSMLYIDE